MKDRWLRACLRWFCLLLLMVTSTGCLRYDLGIQFDHADHGQIVQQIRLDAAPNPAFNAWLEQLSGRVRRLGGQVRRGETTTLTVPFTTGEELLQRFRQMFPEDEVIVVPQLGEVRSHLSLQTGNYLFAVRHHLVYDLDLRDLPAEVGAPVNLSSDWLDFHFQLKTPWGLKQAAPDDTPSGDWRLQPGQNHHVDVVIWVPSWLGIGSGVIVIWVLLGYFLKYGLKRRSPRRQTSRSS